MPNLPIVALLHMISAGPLAASTSIVLQSAENISTKERSIPGCWQRCAPQTLACCRQSRECCRGGTQCSLCLDVKHLAWEGLHGNSLAVMFREAGEKQICSPSGKPDCRVNVSSAISGVFMFSEGKLFGPGSQLGTQPSFPPQMCQINPKTFWDGIKPFL